MRFREILFFEITYQLRRPSTWVYFLTLCGLLLMVISEMADYARTVERVVLNSPLAVAEITGYTNKFGLFLIALLAGDGAIRDIQWRMDPLVFTTSIKKATYLGGRVLATIFLAVSLLSLAVPLSLFAARLLPGFDPALFNEFNTGGHIASMLYLTIPNVVCAALILYAAVLLSRQAMAAFVGAIVLFLLCTFNMELAAGNWALAKLIDPSGMTVVNALSESLTPVQKTKATLQVTGSFILNRMLWIAISIVVGSYAFNRFKLQHQLATESLVSGFFYRRGRRVHADSAEADAQTLPVRTDHRGGRAVRFNKRKTSRLAQIFLLTARFCREILFGPMGLFIPVIAIYAFILIPNMAGGPMGVPILFTTERIILFLNNAALEIFIALLISLLAGKLVWRERDARLNEIADAVPVPDMIMILSKYLALAFILFILAITLIISGTAIQFFSGYFETDTWLFIRMVAGVQLLEFLIFSAIALALHVLINNKYIGHLAVMCFYMYTLIAPRFITDHKLLNFGSDLGLSKSVFYDQSAFILPWILFKLYWMGWALLLFIIAKSLWVRGRETGFKLRFRNAVRDLKTSVLLPLSLAMIVIAGGFIFYNSYVLNEYKSGDERTAERVDYERKYARFKYLSQPNLSGTILNIELYPEKRAATIQGAYQLINRTTEAIKAIHLATSLSGDTESLKFSKQGKFTVSDKKLGYWIYTLDQFLQPGDSLNLDFTVKVESKGFPNSGIRTELMNNGTYFTNAAWFPSIGYQEERELDNAGDRKDFGLPKQEEHPSYLNEKALMNTRGKENIRVEATIGTTPGQIALAPGRLKNTWLKNGRRYFHYKTDAPVRAIYHIYSAEYAVRKAKWQDVNLQIFHHPKSVLNLDGIEKSMKASLEYYSSNFTAYRYNELRFVEYADPGTGGISLPGSVGFNTNYAMLNSARDDRGFDLAFAVGAHEIAHQWWAHQLIPAEVTGKALITESLAWYSAFSVIERTYGAKHLHALLEAMRADYLNPRARAGTSLLESTESFQGYRKGPFAMFALREYIGERAVNTALKNLLLTFKSEEPPYATSRDLFKELRRVTPDSLQYLLRDLFETNTFWDLKAKNASARLVSKSEWLVSMDLIAKKVIVDKDGLEKEQKMNDLIEIGVFSGERPLYLKRHRIRPGLNRIVVKVSEKPVEAGIDPRKLLVDTEGADNVTDLRY